MGDFLLAAMEATDERAYLDEALRRYREAELAATDPAAIGHALAGQAAALMLAYRAGGPAEDLDRSMVLFNDARRVIPPTDPGSMSS